MVHKARLKRLFRALDGVADAVLLQGDGQLLSWLTGTTEGAAVATKRGVTMIAHAMFAEACGETPWPVVVLTKELAQQRRSCRIAARAAKAVPLMCQEGMTEIDLHGEIVFHMAEQGAVGAGMVSFGSHTSHPHVVVGKRRLKKGDFVMVDFGCNVGGVGSDITRTFVFGKASAKQKAVYDEVWKACQLSFELIEKKKDVRAINKAVGELFTADGYGPFIHSIGHGLGFFGGAFHNVPGAVNTVEPGIYVPGFGGVRIEDDILIIGPGEYELLTGASPRSKLIEI
jgi:Xaa-Pro dipeptidase